MHAKGLGLRTGVLLSPSMFTPIPPDATAALLADWLDFGGPPDYTEIPYDWIAWPVTWQIEPLANSATVDTADGASAKRVNDTSVASFGEREAPAVTLSTQTPSDAANLAQFTVDYRSDPRYKPLIALVDLTQRTDAECCRILAVRAGMRVVVPDAPATWPEGSGSFVVEGTDHVGRADSRQVLWRTSAVLGATHGTPGPWFRYGSSSWGAPDVIPF